MLLIIVCGILLVVGVALAVLWNGERLVTPAFPGYVSGHSTFSAAAAKTIAGLRNGGDAVTITGSVGASGIGFETGNPARLVILNRNTLSAAAASAGLSRRVGGIHFKQRDLVAGELRR